MGIKSVETKSRERRPIGKNGTIGKIIEKDLIIKGIKKRIKGDEKNGNCIDIVRCRLQPR